jgi:presenilin-like A22 family membrane protease
MSRGKYKVVSFGTVAPLIGTLIGITLLVFFCTKGLPKDTGGSIVSIATVIAFIGGGFGVFLAILKKDFLSLK